MAKKKVSVCIITYNEEDKIADCLKSVTFADEVILVDSLSNDRTIEVANQTASACGLNLVIIEQEFLGHVGQKNFAISKAQYDWIYCIDADERCSPQLIESIQKVLDSDDDSQEIWANNRITYYVYDWVRYSGWYPDRKIRLFKKGAGKWDGDNPHDFFNAGDKKAVFLKGDLLHYSFDSISDHLKTIDSFTSIAAAEALEKGKTAGPFSILGHSIAIFIKMYFLRRGFLDGALGFILAGLSAFHVWTKYSKIWIAHKKQNLAGPPDKARSHR